MTKEKKGKQDRKKELAMLALLEKSTEAEAAKAVKVGEATFIGGFVKRTSRRTTGALNRKF